MEKPVDIEELYCPLYGFRPLLEITTDSAVVIGAALFIHKYDPNGSYGTHGVSPGLNLKFYGGPGKFVGRGQYGVASGEVIKGIRVHDSLSDDDKFFTGPDDSIFLEDHNGGLLLPFDYEDIVYHYRVAIPYKKLPKYLAGRKREIELPREFLTSPIIRLTH